LLGLSDKFAGQGVLGNWQANELARRGIPGIKYSDRDSRARTNYELTHNYVVFPEFAHHLKIVKREKEAVA
jgi:hypothetical protein